MSGSSSPEGGSRSDPSGFEGGRTVTVYTRAGCHLCREAERIVAEVAHGRAEIHLVDIDADPEITERYTVRVPVVAVDGRELFEFQVDPDELRAALGGAPA